MKKLFVGNFREENGGEREETCISSVRQTVSEMSALPEVLVGSICNEETPQPCLGSENSTALTGHSPFVDTYCGRHPLIE